tara:strand:+ start:1725 stop:2285 length:561 start_codon:yes stop_codon:yes gene_type:complete
MLKINFECFKYKRWPKVKIFVDGDLLEEVHFSQQYEDVQMPLSVLEGEHLLEIEHFDKNNNDTQYVNGEILQDTKFEIKNINIFDYDIPHSPLLSCNFVPEWSRLTRPKNFADQLPQTRVVGPNGIWSFRFCTPIEDWIINQRRKINNLNNVVTYESYEVDSFSVIDYQMTDEDRQLIKDIQELIK